MTQLPSPTLPPSYLAPSPRRQRIKLMTIATYGTSPAPISCSGFNRDGTIFAYAVSYDWSKGYSEYNPQTMKNAILLHSIKEDEVKPKPKATAAGGRK